MTEFVVDGLELLTAWGVDDFIGMVQVRVTGVFNFIRASGLGDSI